MHGLQKDHGRITTRKPEKISCHFMRSPLAGLGSRLDCLYADNEYHISDQSKEPEPRDNHKANMDPSLDCSAAQGKKSIIFGLTGNITGAPKPKRKNVCH